MVRGELLSQKLKSLGFSVAILLISAQGQAIATSVTNTNETNTNTPKPQLELSPLESPPAAPTTPQPSPGLTPPPAAPTTPAPPPENSAQDISLVIKLSDRRVYVHRAGKVETSYPIAVGKKGWETPTGTFKILQMQRDPSWEHPWTGQVIPPGPNNPLGNRWIGFWTDGKNFIGFHGTPNERLVGQAVSHGCIRMRNRDVMALFEQVRVGTPVTVVR